MAVVHAAKDSALERVVAFKRIRPEVASEENVARFLDEIRITAQLEHPNVVPIYSLDRTGKIPGFSMKRVQGETLAEILDEARAAVAAGRDPAPGAQLPELLDLFAKVCEGVHFAHTQGFVHRDLKPENVMVCQHGEVYVLDWGIAKPLGAPPPSDEVASFVGTPAYMAPEQADCRHEEIDQRTDVYALGLILFEIVSLRRARPSGAPEATILKALEGELVPLEHLDPHQSIPGDLAAIVHKATALEPGARYPTPAELELDVQAFGWGKAVSARPDSLLRGTLRWMSHHSRSVAVALVSLVALIAVLFSWSLWRQAEQRREARANQARLAALLTRVGKQANTISQTFSDIEGALGAFSSASAHAVSYGREVEETTYSNDDLGAAQNDPTRAPPDFRPHEFFGGTPTSYAWPVNVFAPGSEARHEQTRRQLSPLRHLVPRLLASVEAPSGDPPPPDVPGAVIEKMFLGLESEFFWMLPGQHFERLADFRQRPWYLLAARKRGFFWGRPYVELSTHRYVLPCSTSLYRGETFLGVAATDLTFARLTRMLRLPDVPHVRETYLVDGQGHVVVRSSDPSRPSSVDESATRPTPLFPIPQLLPVLREGKAGYLETSFDGRSALLAHYPLGVSGWQYVVWTEPPRRSH
jgi:eukaryotic-like serine/threonine-protein kinase